MTNVAVIPIDNRPICYDLIEDILSTDNNINIHMPDLSLLGGLCSSSNIEGLFNFIESLPHVDYFVVALDTLAYGGLVTSRRCEESFDTIKKRIEKLKNIIPKNARVLAFSSVMRISNNNINEEEKPYWAQYGKKIFEWSYEKGKEVWKYGIKDTNELYTYIPPSLSPSSIPPEILDDYLNTRKRNFEINKLYLDMAREGFFDTLIFSKDDCAQFGLNVEEAIELENIIKRDNILNTYIKTGADEIPLTLLARALSRGYDIKINPLFIEPQGTNLISKYEDISIKDCILSQISLAGLEVSKKCDLEMIVNNFQSEQGDLVLGDRINSVQKNIYFPKTPYFIADVNNANGADCNLIEQLLKQKTNNFFGYSGYNTSANTIGSAILSAVVKYIAIKNNSYNDNNFKKIQFIRLLDDWAYQAISRKYVRNSAPEFQKALLDKTNELNNNAKKISDFLNYQPQKINYSLPWERSFEIRIKV